MLVNCCVVGVNGVNGVSPWWCLRGLRKGVCLSVVVLLSLFAVGDVVR